MKTENEVLIVVKVPEGVDTRDIYVAAMIKGGARSLVHKILGAPSVQSGEAGVASDEEIAAWADRYHIDISSDSERRCAFEDARTLKPAPSDSAQAELDQRDAERYRSLRQYHYDWELNYEYVQLRIPCELAGFNNLDEVVDAAAQHITETDQRAGE